MYEEMIKGNIISYDILKVDLPYDGGPTGNDVICAFASLYNSHRSLLYGKYNRIIKRDRKNKFYQPEILGRFCNISIFK